MYNFNEFILDSKMFELLCRIVLRIIYCFLDLQVAHKIWIELLREVEAEQTSFVKLLVLIYDHFYIWYVLIDFAHSGTGSIALLNFQFERDNMFDSKFD